MIPRWPAGLALTGADHRVLLVIACHARSDTRIAYRSIEQIANETNLDRRNVQRAIRRLEAKGVLKQLRGGGRCRGSHAGRSSEYQIIFAPPADPTSSVDGAAVSDAGGMENSISNTAVIAETAAHSDLNSGVYAAPTESEQRKEITPPSGEVRAHTRVGEEFSNDGVDRKPQARLRSVEDDLERRVAMLKAYNPSAETIQFAADLGMNALGPRVLGKFMDWHITRIKKIELPNYQAIEAAYRIWLRGEPRFAARSRHRSQQYGSNGAAAESEAAVEAFRRMRAAIAADGAGND
jgi:hypothetical protein